MMSFVWIEVAPLNERHPQMLQHSTITIKNTM